MYIISFLSFIANGFFNTINLTFLLSIYEYCNYNSESIDYVDEINAYIEKDKSNIYYLNRPLICNNKYSYSWIVNDHYYNYNIHIYSEVAKKYNYFS